MYSIRRMLVEDIEFAVRLTDTMNWNLTEKDFKFMMEVEPEGCFTLMHNTDKIGVTTTISFGKIGWIGCVIVDSKHRRRGGGSAIVKHAVNYLRGKGAETICLYSYKEKLDFYMRLGFKPDLEFIVLSGKAYSPPVDDANIREAGKIKVHELISFDEFHFGASRGKLLEKIANAKGNLCYYYGEKLQIQGYVMAKVYNGYAEVGPLVCGRQNMKAAVNLLAHMLNRLNGYEVSVCLPRREEPLIKILLDAGFKESFSVVRMHFGPQVFRDCIYIAESLERG